MTSAISQKWLLGSTWCQLQAYILTVLTTAIQYSLFVIAIDRNYAITNSLRYPCIFSPRLCLVLLLVTWCLGLVLGLPPLVNYGHYTYLASRFLCDLRRSSNNQYALVVVLVEYLVPCLGQLGFYFSIFRAAVRHTRQTNRVYPLSPKNSKRSGAAVPNPGVSDCKYEGISVGKTTRTSLLNASIPQEMPHVVVGSKTKYKAVKTLLVILVSYVLCWTGNIVCSVFGLAERQVSRSLDVASVCLMLLSCVLNPVVFAFMNKSIRHELSKFCLRGDDAMTQLSGQHENCEVFSHTGLTSVTSSRLHSGLWTTSTQFHQPNAAICLTKSIQMVTIQEVSENDGATSCDNVKRDVCAPPGGSSCERAAGSVFDKDALCDHALKLYNAFLCDSCKHGSSVPSQLGASLHKAVRVKGLYYGCSNCRGNLNPKDTPPMSPTNIDHKTYKGVLSSRLSLKKRSNSISGSPPLLNYISVRSHFKKQYSLGDLYTSRARRS